MGAVSVNLLYPLDMVTWETSGLVLPIETVFHRGDLQDGEGSVFLS